MRLVLTCNHSPWSPYSGGGQRSTHNLACALAARGHHVTVVFTKPPWEPVQMPPHLPYRVRWAGLWDVRSRRQAPLRPLTAVTVARQVSELVAEGAQVVHANGEEAALLPRLRQRLPFALVVTPRYPSLPPALLQRDQGGTLRAWSQRLRLALHETKYVTLGAALRGADAVSPPSHYAADLMQRAYRLRDAQMRPVHNGVPLEFLAYDWSPTPTPTPTAGPGTPRPLFFFGRFAEDKGVDTLIDALSRLGVRAPAAVIAGRGPLRSRLVSEVQRRGLDQRVTWRDWLSHDALGAQLQASAMAALPSREENFSLAVLSVMAVGTPLITTPVGGTPEVMQDGRTGSLHAPGDAAGLARAIERVQADPKRAATMAGAAKQRVRTDFTWQAAAARFEDLYASLLEDGAT